MGLLSRLTSPNRNLDAAHASADEQSACRLIDEGNVIEEQRRFEDALRLYESAVRLAPHLARGHRNLGNALLELGSTDRALEAYARAVACDPDDAGTHCNVGNAHLRSGQYDHALHAYGKAIALNPGLADAEAGSGAAFDGLGQKMNAIASYGRALKINPTFVQMHVALGGALQSTGRLTDAIASYRAALALDPDLASVHNNMGVVFASLGPSDDALKSYQRALALRPDFAEARFNLGNAQIDAGNTSEAIESYRRALADNPDLAEAHCNLGSALDSIREHSEAIECFRRALRIRPDFLTAHVNLGNALQSSGLPIDAIASFRGALAVDPGSIDALTNLGVALQRMGCLGEAEACHRRVLECSPGLAEAHNNLGNTHKDAGNLVEAVACYRTAIELRPAFSVAHSNLLLAMSYSDDFSIEERVAEARSFGRRQIASVVHADPWRFAVAPTRLRIGMVSGDLRSHPVGYFLEGLLTHLNPQRVELIAYPTFEQDDDTTAVIRPHFSAWKPLCGLSDEGSAEMIRADGVHVLIDLSGHTSHNRLPLFALGAAPVQVSWLGYFATTGIARMDYILGDPHVTPAADVSHFIERIWRLPESYLCFSPPKIGPDIGPLPAEKAGYVTFGSFNNLAKMNEVVVKLWARVLSAVPRSRLLLKTAQLNDGEVREMTRRRFAAAGVDPERLKLEESSPRSELLATYNRVDIALDPFPYPGGTTTAEGLWMGVPVITKRGDRFLSRVGETIAQNSGQSSWIAVDGDDYVAKAVVYSSDLSKLAKVRAGLREQVLASPLFDGARFARHFESAMQQMWQDWEAQQKDST